MSMFHHKAHEQYCRRPPRGVFITSPVLRSDSSSSVQEQYVFIHQCVLLMWQKKKQQSITSDVIYENASKT